ncbi:hybrid sensor histidine kinase/response regulator [Acidovorax sp. SUPP2522]|uniref:ATP-binding response regulator n=1 Tax=unclassified Acidovorax TaxID=2684926 RepID=UPI002349C5F0|nr:MULTISPECIES: hybrid sensor histidine kinase/response regulator [unclassified Acidovorax]WCM96042.1 hybrid sensor histidine kinase/response regulator [Acidovorax sp. GBBC 1281]GKT18765.1 hybrid sensor histidine kinase/response regulator [Acidovorax sp. SUPP2522]
MPIAPDSRYPDAWHAEPAADAQTSSAVLDLAVRRRLLQSFASRGGASEIPALVIPGVLTWLHARTGAPSSPMLWWWGALLAFAGLLWAMQWRFRRDTTRPDAEVVPRWERIFQVLAVVDGLLWVVPIALTQGAPQDFRLLVYLVMCAVIASGTTFLAPQPRVFFPFFVATYGPILAAVTWYFPERWQAMLALVALFGGVILRHAWGSRRFVVQQVEMERQRLQLAERYRAAKEEAERALEEKNRFYATASHDLRQPLHALGLLMETAIQRNTDAQLVPVLDGIQDCARSLSFMFDALLDLSRLESSTYEVRREPVALTTVFGDVATVFGPDAQRRGLRLRFGLPRRRLPTVHTDGTLLRQMIFNLVQNALRYTSSGGMLVGIRARGTQWRIEVRDTGPGVPLEDQHRLYAPFYRGGARWTQEVAGHGLGLSVVARSARLIGATYGFQSTPGRGSCFWLSLDAAPDGLPQDGKSPGDVSWQERMGSLSGRCLLVEDDPQVATAVAALLRSWGLEVDLAATAQQALQIVDAGPLAPGAVLCDQRLAAGQSGFELLQELLRRCPAARGALVSGEHQSAALAQAEEEGYLVFRKPLSPAQLHAVLARWFTASV